MGPRVREDDKRYVHSGVVPAKAGTHTPGLIVLARGLTPSATTKAGGYGSSRSRGRQIQSTARCAGTTALRPRPALQHPGDAEVFVEFRPVNPHRHQFEVPTRGGTGLPQPRIPLKRGRDPAAIG